MRLLRALFGGFGRLCAVFAAPVEARIVCVFATASVGGAERVHAEIVRAIADDRPEVWFTEPPRNDGLLSLYAANAEVRQLGARLRCRLCAYFQAGFQAGRIRRGGVGVVFGAFSHFFYDMLPWLKGVRCVDLMHNFGVNFENYSLPHVGRLDRRVLITAALRDQVVALYGQRGVPAEAASRLTVIGNAVAVPSHFPAKTEGGPLRILYSGRGTPEKRVHLVGQVAARLKAGGVAAQVVIMGDVAGALSSTEAAECRLTGMLTDPVAVAAQYQAAQVLLITSSREGFPVAVMEAMAQGVVPLCTRVGGLATLPDGNVCRLVDAEPEQAVVESITAILRELEADRARLQAMSLAAWNHARVHFDVARFDKAWRELLVEGRA